ncbi:MAG: hypothetical protein LBR45_04660, partial [Bacteroidales bacterium]|nr:hypothetical protein [Bacteroidales bacterium]
PVTDRAASVRADREISSSREEFSSEKFSIGDYSNIGNTISDILFTETEKQQLTLTDSLSLLSQKATKNAPTDIDKFLNNPNEHKAIKVDKNKDYSQILISDSSTKEDLSTGTETIARLYAQQGHPQKAEIIYRNLIERYPEKILYYNTLIRKLKSS